MHAQDLVSVIVTAVFSEEDSNSVTTAGMDLPTGLHAVKIKCRFSTPNTNTLFT